MAETIGTILLFLFGTVMIVSVISAIVIPIYLGWKHGSWGMRSLTLSGRLYNWSKDLSRNYHKNKNS